MMTPDDISKCGLSREQVPEMSSYPAASPAALEMFCGRDVRNVLQVIMARDQRKSVVV